MYRILQSRPGMARCHAHHLTPTLQPEPTTAIDKDQNVSSLFSRSVVLSLARLTNYVVLLLSPIFLVRVLDITTYGQYREFVLYALLAATLLAFSVGSSILYFVAREPQHSAAYIGNSVIFQFISSAIGLTVIYSLRELYTPYLSFDFAGALVLYVFFFLNLDILESIWLATKKARLVFIYSAARTLVRTVAVICAAIYSGNILVILYTMIGIEALKFTFLLLYFLRMGWIRASIDVALAREQLRFLAPLAIAAIVYNLNQKVGSIFVSTQLGAVALAIYSIGVYQIPIIGIVRSAVADAIFPEMVERNVAGGGDALKNWRHANVVLVALVLPLVVTLIVHAKPFIETLFTAQYLDAVPIFQISMLLMFRQCFEFGSPLRAANATRDFFRGNFYAFIINLILVALLVRAFGAAGAITSLLLAEIYLMTYLARRIMRAYGTALRDLLSWSELSKLLALAILSAPLLTVGWWVTDSPGIAALLGSGLYLGWYMLVLRYMELPEIQKVIQRLATMLRARTSNKT